MIYNYEELVIWQRARNLVRQVYFALQDNKDFGFRDQIQRAVISIMNNIAEGFDRNKYTKNNAMFISFLGIAIGSCGEVKSMLYAGEDIGYISVADGLAMRNQCTDLQIKMHSLIHSLKNKSNEANNTK